MTALAIPRRPGLRCYWAVACIALRQRSGERTLWLGRVLFLGLLMLIFSRLWHALLPGDAAGMSAADCVWYIAITEWLTLAAAASVPRYRARCPRRICSASWPRHWLNRRLACSCLASRALASPTGWQQGCLTIQGS
jgi:hypothetical protein